MLVRRLVLMLALVSAGCRAPLEVPPLPPVEQGSPTVEPELIPRSGAGELPRVLLVAQPGTPAGVGLAIERTEVEATVLGDEAHVRVRQRVVNPYDRSIAVVYEFALPEHAVVDRVRARAGERTIASEVRPRESSRGAPQTNLFRQTISHVPANASVEIELDYLQPSTREGGEHELVVPLVPSQPNHGSLSLRLTVEAGAPIERWTSSTKRLEVTATATGLSATLDEFDQRDLVLRWTPTTTETRATLYRTSPGTEGHGYFRCCCSAPSPCSPHASCCSCSTPRRR